MMSAPVSMDQIEQSKENIIPVKSGRKPTELARVLAAMDSHDASEDAAHRAKVAEFEEAVIRADESDNPLEPWIAYISYVRGVEISNPLRSLKPLLLRCARHFVNVNRFRNDAQYLRVWTEYADLCGDPLPVFAFLMARRIGEDLALFYISYATVLEHLVHACADADTVFQHGLQVMAHPVSMLRRFYEDFLKRHPQPCNQRSSESSELEPSVLQRRARKFGAELDASDTTHRPTFAVQSNALPTAAPAGDVGRRPLACAVFVEEEIAGKENTSTKGAWNKAGLPTKAAPKQAATFEIFSDFSAPSVAKPQESIAAPKKAEPKKEMTGYSAELLKNAHGEETQFEMHRALLKKYSVLPKSPQKQGPARTPLSVSSTIQSATASTVTKQSASQAPVASTPLGVKSLMMPMDDGSSAKPKFAAFKESPTVHTKRAMREVLDMFSSPLMESPVVPASHGASLSASISEGAGSSFAVFEDDPASMMTSAVPDVIYKPISALEDGETTVTSLEKWPAFEKLNGPVVEVYAPAVRGRMWDIATAVVEATSKHLHNPALQPQWDVGDILGEGAHGTVIVNALNPLECVKVFNDVRLLMYEYFILRHCLAKGRFVRIDVDRQALLMPKGDYTLQDAVNGYRTANGRMDEVLVMYYALLVMREMLWMHTRCGVVHGDLKPDNIVVVRGKARRGKKEQPKVDFRTDGNSLLFVDMGNAVPVAHLFSDPDHVKFVGSASASGFRCAQQRRGDAWMWDCDRYGVAAVIYLMLHNEYMPEDSSLRKPFKRYWRREMWQRVFSALLSEGKSHGDVEGAAELVREQLSAVDGVEDILLTYSVQEHEFVDMFFQQR
jgi:hypothetical protein